MDCSSPGSSVLHYLLEFVQIYVHWVSDAILPSHLLLPLLLLPSVIPRVRVFSSELPLHIRWPKCWNFSFSNNSFQEYSEWISFRTDWFDLAVQATLRCLLNTTVQRVNSFIESVVNKAEVDVFFFWNFLAFSMIQQKLTIWSLVPLPFPNPAWTSGSSQFTYCWSLAWRILSITLLVCEMSAIVQYSEHSLALPFFGIGMKTDLFQSCGHCWIFQICWHMSAAP